MKKAIFTLSLLFATVLPSNAQVFWTEDFEATSPTSGVRSAGAHANTTNGSGPGTCSVGDYFLRTNDPGDPDNIATGYTAIFTGYEGTYYWRGEDLDACIVNPDVIDFTGIDIAGRTGLGFLGLFGARTTASWEGMDEIRVEYQVDGGGYTTGIVFEPNATLFYLGKDFNNDGVGDGPTLTAALVEHTFLIPETGITLDLRITCNANGDGKEFAFDFFRIENGVLPVELISFDATTKNKNILLEWQTASEEENDYFQLEHSIDRRSFEAFSQIPGNGTTAEIINYSYLHTSPKPGVNYYRLKQVDVDGAFEYSKIIGINFKGESGQVGEFYPNPSKSGLVNLDYSSEIEEEITVSVFDITGKLIFNEIQQILDGNNNLIFNFSNLNTGIYFVKIGDEENPVHRKLIIER